MALNAFEKGIIKNDAYPLITPRDTEGRVDSAGKKRKQSCLIRVFLSKKKIQR